MILVTGATGFIGRAIVRRLLAAGRPVLVLARGRDRVAPRARVLDALGELRPGAALAVVAGDLVAPGAGLAASDLARLRATVETVIHCAGDTTFWPADEAVYRAGHVDGPLGLLGELAHGRLARWIQLSTAYVCGRRAGPILEGEADVGQAFTNPYERAKLEAERTLARAGAALGVDVRVARPSIVVGAAPATAGGTPSGLFFAFIRLLAALRALPPARLRVEAAPRAPFNIVPVDYVAAAVVALAERPAAAGGTFHLVVRNAPTQAAMLAMIAERLGVAGVTLVDARAERLRDPSPLERAVRRMLEPYRDYLTHDARFDDAAAARALAGSGVPRPVLSPPAVHRLVDLALLGDGAPDGARPVAVA